MVSGLCDGECFNQFSLARKSSAIKLAQISKVVYQNIMRWSNELAANDILE